MTTVWLVRISTVTRLEIGFAARSVGDYRELIAALTGQPLERLELR